MSIADVKAWMADHVFLTIGIAVALTFVLIWVSSEVLRRFHLRLLQTAAVTTVGCGLWVVSMGLSNVWLMLAGAAAGALSFYAGTRLDSLNSAEIAKLKAELGKAKTATPLHFVIDPNAKAAG
jgi:hypothetical protein